MERIPYDNEGFNISFYKNYQFKEDANPDKIVDTNNKFYVQPKTQFHTFDDMRRSLETRSCTSSTLKDKK